ncbi:MAG: PspC domain-containing protein [Chloroflexota bacterium]|nr:PspC domain-containing protein [Chloroflexota bacterium]
MDNRLHRSRKEKMIAGVCGGLAEYFRIDPTIVRLAFVLLTLADGIGVLAYLILWAIMPKEERAGAPTEEVVRENVQEIKEEARRVGEEIKSAFGGEEGGEELKPAPPSRTLWAGGILILLGCFFLLRSLGLLWWFDGGRLWPLILIAIGVIILVDHLR